MDGAGTTPKSSQGEIPVVDPQNCGQLKFTNMDGRGQAGGAAGGGALGPTTEIDFDFNILANYLAEEVQLGKSDRDILVCRRRKYELLGSLSVAVRVCFVNQHDK